MGLFWIILIVIGAALYFIIGSALAGAGHRFLPSHTDPSLFDAAIILLWPVTASLFYLTLTCAYTIRWFEEE